MAEPNGDPPWPRRAAWARAPRPRPVRGVGDRGAGSRWRRRDRRARRPRADLGARAPARPAPLPGGPHPRGGRRPAGDHARGGAQARRARPPRVRLRLSRHGQLAAAADSARNPGGPGSVRSLARALRRRGPAASPGPGRSPDRPRRGNRVHRQHHGRSSVAVRPASEGRAERAGPPQGPPRASNHPRRTRGQPADGRRLQGSPVDERRARRKPLPGRPGRRRDPPLAHEHATRRRHASRHARAARPRPANRDPERAPPGGRSPRLRARGQRPLRRLRPRVARARGGHFAIGLQWHPEDPDSGEAGRRMGEALVDAALGASR